MHHADAIAVTGEESIWIMDDASPQEENTVLKARLGAEMKEKHLLEAKNRELFENIVDCTSALKTTGDLLAKVHEQIAELKAKVDARENQLHESLRMNKILVNDIMNLEHRLVDVQAESERQVSAKDGQLSELEQLQIQLQSQRDKVWRENFMLSELNLEQLDNIESKDRKISNLERHSFSLQEVISHMHKTKMTSSDNDHDTAAIVAAQLPPQPVTEKPSKLRFNKWLS